MLSFSDARKKVIEVATAHSHSPAREVIDLISDANSHAGLGCQAPTACGRVLAEPIAADRDYPPFDRSTRDGFAVRAADAAHAGAVLQCIGEIKAGSGFDKAVGAGQCVQIMTGAAVPRGADSVVMIEHVRIAGQSVTFERPAELSKNIVPTGSEARAGQELLPAGTRLSYAEMAIAGQVGRHRISVWARPRVAILSTGDEVVDIDATPGPLQIRNGNGVALETLVALTGGEPMSLGNAPDETTELRRRIERGLEADVLVLSGGVSMGKYDLVEGVLADLGAKFFFDSVEIRPGRPAVFGECRGKLVFGLPGNPVSTMVTFELFVVPALDIMGGALPRPLPLLGARLAHDVHERGALTRFVPARVTPAVPGGEPWVSALDWQGSGDSVAVARANAFLVVPPEKLDWVAGEWAMVLPRRGAGGEMV
jgi:molybdopterin molybdotransferase